jgi:nitrite reductase/ring-hydroxylating ferredoxin subunit
MGIQPSSRPFHWDFQGEAVTTPARSMISGARAAMRQLADRTTPLIRNEWYVAALSGEVGRTLLRRTLLGTSVVLFRTTGGTAVAMDNRCPHRSYPLSSGTLDGDSIVCGYHGMRFDVQGDCIELPAVANCPKGVGVRTYPLVEKGPVCWIWLGAPDEADPRTIPAPDWMSSAEWAGGTGYYLLGGSYVSLHENLLDTSHLSFLHANTIGSPDYVKAPTTTESGAGRFALNRLVCPTRLPEALGKLTGFQQRDDIARAVRNEFVSPGYYEATTRLYDPLLEEPTRREFVIRAAHMPTPESLTSTHYFIFVARNFAQDHQPSRDAMVANLMKAFEEDVVGLALQEQMQRAAGSELFELSFPSDQLTIGLRRYLKSRADLERTGTDAA